jgi:hypothetical protein
MQISEAFGDIAETIAMLNPQQIVEMKASKKMSDRVEELVSKRKQDLINVDESIELERFLTLNLFISLAKARARMILTQ